jgi:hypothetical protein
MHQFTKLRAVRDKLAAVPSHLVDADTRREIVAAINELDDAMVMSQRDADLTMDYYKHVFGGMAVTS